MNPHSRKHPRPHLGRTRTAVVTAGLALLSLTAAACGSDDADGAAATEASMTTSPAMTSPAMTSDTMTSDTMTSETMTSETMTSDTMASDMTGDTMSGGAMEPAEPSGPGCAAVPADGAGSFAGMAQDPAATAASNNPVLSTLVAAVSKAGLVDTLNGPGPFTIFAPTNDAFAAIPADTLASVMADTDQLTSILTYHVVAGEKMSAADLIAAGSVTTVNGGSLAITDVDGTLTVNGVPSVCMDVPTANATVHIIGGVLLP